MVESSDELERLNREQLVLKARVLGVERAELMTRVELRDEIVRRSEPDLAQQKRARGFLGVARDLVASVVEAGLNLPDAAAIIRGDGAREHEWKGPPPVATVTLAEIYAAQGHLERALRMLDEVLAKEPDHDPARALRDRLAAGTDLPVAPRRRQRISFGESALDLDPAASPEPAPAEPEVAPASAGDDLAPATEATPALAPESDPVPVPVSADAAPATDPEPELSLELPPEPELAPAPAALDPGPAPAPAPPAPAPAPVRSPEPLSLLTLSLAGQRQIYWEIPASTWSSLRARSPQGRAVLRVVSFRTHSGKVERNAHELTPRTEVGSAVLPGLRADSVVRAVLGWESDGRFQPFLIASDLAASARRGGPFRAHPLVGALPAGAEQRALSHFARR